MPRILPDGSRNHYRVVRLKDKLGSKSMASGEIVFEGAVAWQLGALDQGLKQMLVMVNSSRISHAARAAGMMRRCLNEAFQAARHRNAFGSAVIEHPLMRRQMMKLMVPTEQALSTLLYTADIAGRAETDGEARRILRLLTPVVKYRACPRQYPGSDRRARSAAAATAISRIGSMPGWCATRIWRDLGRHQQHQCARRGPASDRKEQAQRDLGTALADRLEQASSLPGQFRTRLETALSGAIRFAESVAASTEHERFSREAASALYHATSAVLLATEGLAIGRAGGDARRAAACPFRAGASPGRAAALRARESELGGTGDHAAARRRADPTLYRHRFAARLIGK
ncbi:MAG: acyl-CoA dehydrogenase family protein [Aliidongia sp.]